MGQGFTANDVDRLIHRSYEALLGEVEARDVQNTQLMEEDLQGYLLPLTSEAILEKDINVFFDKTSSSPYYPSFSKLDIIIKDNPESPYNLINFFRISLDNNVIIATVASLTNSLRLIVNALLEFV